MMRVDDNNHNYDKSTIKGTLQEDILYYFRLGTRNGEEKVFLLYLHVQAFEANHMSVIQIAC